MRNLSKTFDEILAGGLPSTLGHRTPAEPDPGPGWLRSQFMGVHWPRPGVAPCGRLYCPVCAPIAERNGLGASAVRARVAGGGPTWVPPSEAR
jgi:hypothetical protein